MEPPVIAIVGGETLLGREVRDVISEARLPARVRLIGVGDEGEVLSSQGDEPVVISALDEENLTGARVALLAGSPQSVRNAHQLIRKAAAGPAIVDLTGALASEPSARLRAPALEPEGFACPPETIHVVAHPAALALGQFLIRMAHGCRIRRSVIQVFEPASERGREGLDELREQTVALLSFRKFPTAVFDAQLGFNMLVRYGEDAPVKLEAAERRLEGDLAALLAAHPEVPTPSLRLAQAPVFHGYSSSAWVEFEENPGPEALGVLLAGESIDIRGEGVEPPTNVGAAGDCGIIVGAIETDRACPRAAWFWLAADNLRLAAVAGVALARRLM